VQQPHNIRARFSNGLLSVDMPRRISRAPGRLSIDIESSLEHHGAAVMETAINPFNSPEPPEEPPPDEPVEPEQPPEQPEPEQPAEEPPPEPEPLPEEPPPEEPPPAPPQPGQPPVYYRPAYCAPTLQ